MAQDHIIIIGNGPAGNQAARTLKDRAPDARITLISKDHDSCYRPHLLPSYISGKRTREDLYACPLASYKEAGIKLRTGQRVVHIRLDSREAVLEHKEIIPFSGLILAVGGRPRIPEPLHRFKDLMLSLKTLEDAERWKEKLEGAESVLIIGGDLTSFAMTRALLDLGKKVYVLLTEEAFWPMRPDKKTFERAAESLALKGVDVLETGSIKSMTRRSEGHVRVVVEDRRLEVGLVGAFFGLAPDVGFLARSGLTLDRGILVDDRLHTGFDGVYATGDCAQVYHPEIRDYWVSIGYDNAVSLGRMAALNLLGGDRRTDVPKERILEVQGVHVNTSWWTEF